MAIVLAAALAELRIEVRGAVCGGWGAGGMGGREGEARGA